MSVIINVNGTPLDLWDSLEIERSIDDNAGIFNFSTSSTVPPAFSFPVKAEDFINVSIDGSSKITGFVDEVSCSQSGTIHSIDVSGRDNIQDLIDSSVPDDAKVNKGPITLKALCEKMIKELGAEIKVADWVGNIPEFTTKELKGCDFGGTIMDELVNFSRSRQIYLLADGYGRLIIYRPDENVKSSTPLLHRINDPLNNVLSYRVRLSHQKRFRKYTCRSQDNLIFAVLDSWKKTHPDEGEATKREGFVFDKGARESRYLEIEAEETMDDAECLRRASEECNLRRSESQQYTCTVAGLTQTDGTPWDIGQFVSVVDEFADIQGEMMIKAVKYNVNKKSGSTTNITLAPPDAYQVVAEPTAETKRKTNISNGYQRDPLAKKLWNIFKPRLGSHY